MDRQESQSPAPNVLEAGRQQPEPSPLENGAPDSDSGHIRLEAPKRPDLPNRNTFRGQSSKSLSEALRLERSREEQETLLGLHEQADDDGCYPPRISDEPRAYGICVIPI
jgi:hypothetical protein